MGFSGSLPLTRVKPSRRIGRLEDLTLDRMHYPRHGLASHVEPRAWEVACVVWAPYAAPPRVVPWTSSAPERRPALHSAEKGEQTGRRASSSISCSILLMIPAESRQSDGIVPQRVFPTALVLLLPRDRPTRGLSPRIA